MRDSFLSVDEWEGIELTELERTLIKQVGELKLIIAKKTEAITLIQNSLDNGELHLEDKP